MRDRGTYVVKSIFGPTIQGEGSLTGEPTVFIRLAGCNMWDGRAETKAASACPYCDTDFRGGVKMNLALVLDAVTKLLPAGSGLITISGGEPLLQVDRDLIGALRLAGYKVAVETNGTRSARGFDIDHVSLSPKVSRDRIVLERCDDLKVLFPHPHKHITPEAFATFPAKTRYLQPVNGYSTIDEENVKLCIAKVIDLAKKGQHWRLSAQLHKMIGVE